jgi:hypothetical protein
LSEGLVQPKETEQARMTNKLFENGRYAYDDIKRWTITHGMSPMKQNLLPVFVGVILFVGGKD